MQPLIPTRILNADEPGVDPMDPVAGAWLAAHGITRADMVTSIEIHQGHGVALIRRAVCDDTGAPLLACELPEGTLATTAVLIELAEET